MHKQFSLSRKADADLISFFLQQDKRAATLLVAALCSYLKGIPLNFQLNPVTITEQTKRMTISLYFDEHMVRKRESPERKELITMLKKFFDSIPRGMFALYMKGILRHIYGNIIYRTEVSCFEHQPISYYPSIPVNPMYFPIQAQIPVQMPMQIPMSFPTQMPYPLQVPTQVQVPTQTPLSVPQESFTPQEPLKTVTEPSAPTLSVPQKSPIVSKDEDTDDTTGIDVDDPYALFESLLG